MYLIRVLGRPFGYLALVCALFALSAAARLLGFAASQAVRIAHGALMVAGCWWLAWATARPLAPARSARPMERNSTGASMG